MVNQSAKNYRDQLQDYYPFASGLAAGSPFSELDLVYGVPRPQPSAELAQKKDLIRELEDQPIYIKETNWPHLEDHYPTKKQLESPFQVTKHNFALIIG